MFGATLAIAGAGPAPKVNFSAATAGLVPRPVVTLMSTVLADAAWGEAMICWSLTTRNEKAGTVPNLTPVVLLNPMPLIVTPTSPEVGPVFGLIEAMLGVDLPVQVNLSAEEVALVPACVPTVTSTVPDGSPGLRMVMVLELTTFTC